MSYYINKETLEVKVVSNDNLVMAYEEVKGTWVEYPFDESEPEKYPLKADSGDITFGEQLNNLFESNIPIDAIIAILKEYNEGYKKYFPKYDYFTYEIDSIHIDDWENEQILKPYGCYNVNAENALRWYKEQKDEIERRRETKRKLEHLKKELEELEK